MPAKIVESAAERTEASLSEVIEKIVAYSRSYHENRPDAPIRHCLELGAGKILGDLDQSESRLVQLALTEMAARWTFTSPSAAAAE